MELSLSSPNIAGRHPELTHGWFFSGSRGYLRQKNISNHGPEDVSCGQDLLRQRTLADGAAVYDTDMDGMDDVKGR